MKKQFLLRSTSMSAMISKKKLFACLLCVSVCIILKKHVANMVLTHFPQRSCKKCLPECDLGAMKRFNKSVEPFLSAKCTLSEVAFTWWKGLQNEKRDFISYKATVDHLLKMFPAAPDVVGASPDRCRTCAVVGNSANLKGSLYGTLIDFHDVIIRMNQGHTKGYEADVGTRTNIHIMYPESAIDLDDNTHLVLVPFKIMDLEWLIQAFTTGFTGESYRPIKSKIKANKDMVMVVNPDFMRSMCSVTEQTKMETGIIIGKN
ncbi:CMP-N-acetylneuraminate-beta-galactosamide-alpha-2,3-sialyltransferase 1-like isoform X2 [Echeneis naucrates]|uniref:CMP-N-acetylneuraminate-beta-galactosamide- alpha-2,3-sialyltransferase 1-like isoform X2 n=1 Tax=Echeneis naucrates TaxID=173247 RepID=UPI0011145984|nr:CMP-N-acetylneuraminate-beta-galactosamide-alpha-2,3-sialyltransferase 1-like isoform X2 [Echeneis naucrates]